jgi:hypothetical protein
MMNGMVGLIRSRQQVWLTPEQFKKIQDEIGIFRLDSGNNDCPQLGNDHCNDTQMQANMGH